MSDTPLYGGVIGRRVTVRDLAAAKERREIWPMLTAYDYPTARIFDEAGIPVLLVGDSAANVVYGYDTTVPVTVEELLPLVRAVVRGTSRALVVADLPFGSYQGSPSQALETAALFLKNGRAQAVKLEGGRSVTPQVELLVQSGVPVMAHLGLTPQSVNTLGGFRVQGRGDDASELLADAHALQNAGVFALVLEAVPAELAAQVTKELTVPVIGIGAGPDCDAQVMVWQDMAGLGAGIKRPKFVKQYADVGAVIADAARRYADEVRSGGYPGPEHSYS
ncbi:MAG: 3-methyl-2-oxobutanoate hydroxymethyltransferase [Geodermatophilaceae bacterium]